MKLPDIQFDRSMVQESSGAVAQVGAAQRRALETFASGLQALGQELVKTSTQKAAADVESGMAADEADLLSRRYLPLQQVRDELGPAFDSLPEGIKGRGEMVNDGQGGQVEAIPTYLVAGAMFEKRSRERIEKATAQIPGVGWQTAFRDSAGQDLAQRKGALSLQQARAAMEDMKQTQLATVDQYVRAGSWDRALSILDQSDALGPGEKATQRENVLAARQKAEATSARVQVAAAIEGRSAEILQGARVPGYDWLDAAKAAAAVEAIPADDPAKDDVRRLVEHQVARADALRERSGKEVLNRARSLLSQGVPLGGAQMAPLRAWLLDPANGAAGHWETLERQVRTDERVARIERNDRLAAVRETERTARREETERERDAREQAAKDKADQRAADDQAMADFDALPLEEQVKADLAARFPDASPLTRTKLAARQKRSGEALAKDQGVNVGEFKAKVDTAALSLGYGKKDAAAFRTYMLDQYLSRSDPTKPLQPADADKLLAEAVTYADVRHGYDQPMWKVRAAGGNAPPAADQPERVRAVTGLRAAPAGPPARPGAAPAQAPPVSGAKHVTDGKRGAWLPPGVSMPAGWKEG